jgi:hypothetical protein
MNKNISITASIILSVALFFAYANSGLVSAQNQTAANSTSASKTSPQNQTLATITGKAQTTTINKTTVPAEQTSVTVNQTSKPLEGKANPQPLSNQTIQQQVPSLSGIKNKTIVQATGPATTTIVNKTTVPYSQTNIGTENITKSPQSIQQNQSGQSQNKTK